MTPEDADAILPGLGSIFARAGILASIAAPITDHGEPLGVVSCYFDHPRTFDEQAEPLARALAQQAAQTIVRLRLADALRRIEMHDEITGLANRRLFELHFERSVRNRHVRIAVLFIDLDGFKQVNDAHGHSVGDQLLAQVAARLRTIFPEADAVARYGGDEFIALIETEDERSALRIAQRTLEIFREPFEGIPAPLCITASIGVVLSDTASTVEVEQLVRVADHAMCAAKAQGGNRVSSDAVLPPA